MITAVKTDVSRRAALSAADLRVTAGNAAGFIYTACPNESSAQCAADQSIFEAENIMEKTKQESIVCAADLKLWYGDVQALKGISMGVPENKITALIGPSGCGKSTFLKTLNRMNDLVRGVKITGTVTYDGSDIYAPETDVSELRRQVRHGGSKAQPVSDERL